MHANGDLFVCRSQIYGNTWRNETTNKTQHNITVCLRYVKHVDDIIVCAVKHIMYYGDSINHMKISENKTYKKCKDKKQLS